MQVEDADGNIVETEPEALLDAMSAHQHPHDAVRRWMREG